MGSHHAKNTWYTQWVSKHIYRLIDEMLRGFNGMDFICCVIYMHDEEIDKGISYKRMSILRLVMS